MYVYILEIHRGAIWKTFEQIPRGCTYAVIRVVHGSKSVCYCLLLPVGLLVCGFFSKSWEAGRRGEKEEKRMHIFLQSQKMSLWALQHCLGLPVLFHTENGQKDWPKQSNAKFIYCLNALPTTLKPICRKLNSLHNRSTSKFLRHTISNFLCFFLGMSRC